MGVICNGAPKSGTNAVRAIVRRLGFEEVPGGIIRGQYYLPGTASDPGRGRSRAEAEDLLEGAKTLGSHSPGLISRHKIITILLDPKNIAVSGYRARCKKAGVAPSYSDFASYIEANGEDIAKTSEQFRRAPGRGALVVEYESLFKPETIFAIAEYIGADLTDDVMSAYGDSATWSGRPSDWREWLTPAAAQRFNKIVREISSRSGGVVWICGLSGSGKTTIARRLHRELLYRVDKAGVLDGDELRAKAKRQGFSRADRDANVLAAGSGAASMERRGAWVIASLISPFSATRARVRGMCGRFVEVYLSASLKVCERRDVKGLYAKARRGEITNLTGIGSPFEIPQNPDLALDTGILTEDATVQIIVAHLEKLGLPSRDMLRPEEKR